MPGLTVAIVCYKRPWLLEKLLQSIFNADLQYVERIVISCDRHSDETYEQMRKVFVSTTVHLPSRVMEQDLLRQPYRLGIHNHNRTLLNTIAQWRHDSLGYVVLEEDSIVAPDAFNFAHWALQQTCTFVNLGNPPIKDCVPGLAVLGLAALGYKLIESAGWAVTPSAWLDIEPYWNCKMRLPYGWDWSLNYLSITRGWRTIDPLVARVKNTGREDGTYQTAADYDAGRANVVLADTIPDSYKLLFDSISSLTPNEWPEWVKEESKL